jgi:hypothetical protein
MAQQDGAPRNGAVEESDPAHEDGDPWREDQRNGEGHRPVRFPVDSQVVADPGGTRPMSEGHPTFPGARRPKRHRVRWIVIVAIVAAILGAGWYWGLPWVRYFARTRIIRSGVTRAVAEQLGMGLLTQLVRNQAREMAYLDAFWIFTIMAMAALPLVLLMKKSAARGGLAVH